MNAIKDADIHLANQAKLLFNIIMRAFLKSVSFLFILIAGIFIFNTHVSARNPTADDQKIIDAQCNQKYPNNKTNNGFCHSCFEIGLKANTKSLNDYHAILAGCSASFGNGGDVNKCDDCAHSVGGDPGMDQSVTDLVNNVLKPPDQQAQPGTVSPNDVKLPIDDPGKTITDTQKNGTITVCKQQQPNGGDNFNRCLSCGAIAAAYGIDNFSDIPSCDKARGPNYTYCVSNCVRGQATGDAQSDIEKIANNEDVKDSDKGAGSKGSIIDVPGVNCGVPDSPYNRCCRAPQFAFKTNFLDGTDVQNTSSYKKQSSWQTLIRWPGKILKNTLLLPVQGSIEIAKFIFNHVGAMVFDRANSVSTKLYDNLNSGPYQNMGTNPGVCIDEHYLVSTPNNINDPSCICQDPSTSVQGASTSTTLCDGLTGSEKDKCNACNGNVSGQVAGVWTAIGCVPSDIGGFIEQKIFPFGLGLAGIVAMLTIFYSAFLIQTSQGNPERIKKGRQYLNSALLGLGMVIFSVFILQLIGVNILQIPDFTNFNNAPARQQTCPAGKLPLPGGGCK